MLLQSCTYRISERKSIPKIYTRDVGGGRQEISDSQAQAEQLQAEQKALQQQHADTLTGLEQQHQQALLETEQQQQQSMSNQKQQHEAAVQGLQVRLNQAFARKPNKLSHVITDQCTCSKIFDRGPWELQKSAY